MTKSKMAVSGDVTVDQDGDHGNIKLHPYLVTLVRWCVSCVWSTATVLLHRLMTAPLQPITGPKALRLPQALPMKPRRRAGTEHLHPEPKVECQLLHQPVQHDLDVIFVHGLYGSLGNTWRQGDWRQKYVNDPEKVPLIDHSKPNSCTCNKNLIKNNIYNENKHKNNITDLNEPEISFTKINEKLSKKIIPKENDLITEQFYNNTLIDQIEILDNYDTQAKFVKDLFKKETDCDNLKHKNNELENVHHKKKESDQQYNDIKYYEIPEHNRCKCNNENKQPDQQDYDIKYNEIPEHNRCKCNNANKQPDQQDYDIKYNEIPEHNRCKCNSENIKIDQPDNDIKYNEIPEHNRCKCNNENKETDQSNNDIKYNEIPEHNGCKCNKKCKIGCGCICNKCYSDCWPKDWVKEDFPGARVISINYTSDPYLWRPLWIKENKRLNLYQRAEQMIEQLLAMGVGQKPIIWVGHSKGGLFIKQIYCEAYEAYMKTNKTPTNNNKFEQQTANRTTETTTNQQHNGITADNIDTIIGHFSYDDDINFTDNHTEDNDNYTENNDYYTKSSEIYSNDGKYTENNDDWIENNDNCTESCEIYSNNCKYPENNDNCTESNDNRPKNNDNIAIIEDIHVENNNHIQNNDNLTENNYNYTENNDDDIEDDDKSSEIKNILNNQTEFNSNNSENNNNYTENCNNLTEISDNFTKCENNITNNHTVVMDETVANKNILDQISITKNAYNDNLGINHLNNNLEVNGVNDNLYNLKHENETKKINDIESGNDESSNIEAGLVSRASLYRQSRGFMFYSVPHRGSPLALIKTPVTARSVDLLEIAKDCPLVMDLQNRWLAATSAPSAGSMAVRGLVETCRTLMSVLWLRIVSTESADAGIGVLSGINVDHREICKPTSRSCLLYTELIDLIKEAINCKCHKH